VCVFPNFLQKAGNIVLR